MPDTFKIENLYKQSLPGVLEEENKLRKFSILGIAIVFLFIGVAMPAFPYFWPASISCLLVLSLIFPGIKYIKSHQELTNSQIRRTLAFIYTSELLVVFALLYFFSPVIISLTKTVGIMAIPFFCFYLVITYPVFYSKKYSMYFFILSFALLMLLVIIVEIKGISPFYQNYPISEENLIQPKLLRILLPFFLGGFIFFNNKLIMDRYWERSLNVEFEFKQLTDDLQKIVEEKTKDLEEAKAILEIKVEARTSELRELTSRQEEMIKQRAKNLQEKVEELEKFQKLTIGRELKMINLKEENEKLKKLIKNKRSES